MINNIYIIVAQFACLIGWILLIYSYHKQDNQRLLFFQIFSLAFYCLGYIFLGAYIGFFVCLLELIKGVGYYKTDKDNFIFLISIPIYIFMIILCSNVIHLLPIIASIIDSLSLRKKLKVSIVGSIISNALWVIYDIKFFAFTSAITEVLLIVSNLSLLIFKYSIILKSNKLRIAQCRNLSKNVYIAISELDKINYGEEFTWPLDYQLSVKNKSEDNLYLLKNNNEIIGYLEYLVISESEYLNILSSKNIIKDYDIQSLVDFQKGKKNYLILESFNVDQKFQSKESRDLIIKKIKDIIIKSYENSYKIESILAIPFSEFEVDILTHLNFTKVKDYEKNSLYILDNRLIENIYLKSESYKRKYKIIENQQVTEKLLKQVYYLDKKYFKDDYIWPSDYQIKIFNKNPHSMIMVTYEDELAGYLNYLVIKKEKYLKMAKSDICVDDFSMDEILSFQKNKNNFLTLNSIVIDKKHRNGYARKLLMKQFKKNLKILNINGYKILGINSIAVSSAGKKFLKRLGFREVKKLNDGNIFMCLDGEKLTNYLK